MQLTNGTVGEEAEQNEPRAILEKEPADDGHHTQERRQHGNVPTPRWELYGPPEQLRCNSHDRRLRRSRQTKLRRQR